MLIIRFWRRGEILLLTSSRKSTQHLHAVTVYTEIYAIVNSSRFAYYPADSYCYSTFKTYLLLNRLWFFWGNFLGHLFNYITCMHNAQVGSHICLLIDWTCWISGRVFMSIFFFYINKEFVQNLVNISYPTL